MILAIILSLFLSSPAWAGWATNGVDQNWRIVNSAALNIPDNDWTIAFMLRIDAMDFSGGAISVVNNTAGTTAPNPSFMLYCSSSSGPGNFAARIDDDATVDVTPITSFQECNTTGTWRRVIIERDSAGVVKMFLNGSQVASSGNAALSTMTSPGDLYFGTNNASGQDFEGAFCDTAIWTRLLSTAEKLSLNTYSAFIYPQGMTLFLPAIRDFVERFGAAIIINTNSTVIACPSLYRRN